MLDMDKGMEPAKAAQKWIKNHKKKFQSGLNSIEKNTSLLERVFNVT